jgi:glycosyltransferase involved in cell wall biosynthesis
MKIIWVIIPALNEAKYLDKVLSKVKKYTPNIIFVDDGSSDDSTSIARKYTPHVLTHKVNLGKGAALKTGTEYAFGELGADAIVIMDADSQHNPKELPHFFAKLKKGNQVVLGTRDINQKMPYIRAQWNRSVSFLIWLFFGVYIHDIPCGYKAFTKRAYKLLKWQSNNYAVEMEIAARIGKYKLEFVTLPIETIYQDTDRGMTMLHAVGMMGQVINWRLSL